VVSHAARYFFVKHNLSSTSQEVFEVFFQLLSQKLVWILLPTCCQWPALL